MKGVLATDERVWVLRVKGLEVPPFGVKMPPLLFQMPPVYGKMPPFQLLSFKGEQQ